MATLIFDVELLDNRPAPTDGNIFYDIDKDQDMKITRDEMRAFLSAPPEGVPDSHEEKREGEAENREELLPDIFEEQDVDKDGVISFEEFHSEL